MTISGPIKDVQDFVNSLKERGVFAREVNSSGVAFHSYFMDQVAPLIKEKLSKVGILTLNHCVFGKKKKFQCAYILINRL